MLDMTPSLLNVEVSTYMAYVLSTPPSGCGPGSQKWLKNQQSMH